MTCNLSCLILLLIRILFDCQKVNIEKDHLETSLRVRQTEFEACKKEAEMMKVKKDLLETRVHELLEKCQNIDMDDYSHAKEAVQKLQGNISSKDDELKEMRIILSQKDATISQLESKLAMSITEINERESKLNEILQVENTMRLDLEKQKKTGILLKKKMDNLLKEKDDLSKEKQVLSKQLEDYNKQGLKSAGDAAGEQVMKEKDTKIQILERTVARQRELLKKEKEKGKEREGEKLQNTEEAVLENLERSKLIEGIEAHKQVLDRLSYEIEKLKQAKTHLPEDTSVGQIVTTEQLDEISTAYLQALESFEHIAHSVSGGHGTPVVDLPRKLDSSTSVINAGEAVPLVEANIPLAAPVQKQADEKPTVPKSTSIESRKSVRRLVRPHMAKREEVQGGDTEMSETGGSP